MSIDAEVRINDQRKTHVASLDGLRFIAALSVAAAHYAAWTLPAGGAETRWKPFPVWG
jgi:peptidoglycan/LPS O-acetylase OafA/YrhL